MNVYVINLATAVIRKKYVEECLAPYRDFFNVHFVEAVDGRGLSDEQLSEVWNQKETYKVYGRYMKGGEVGCALSHRKCYEEILKNGDDVALIIEDDMSFLNFDVKSVILNIEKILVNDNPAITLLFGDYWYTSKRIVLNETFELVKVHDAIMSTAYLINHKAAKNLLNVPYKYLSDDWYNLKKNGGIALYAVHPHIIDTSSFETEISGDGYIGTVRGNLTFFRKICSYYRAIIKRILGRFGYFEKRG